MKTFTFTLSFFISLLVVSNTLQAQSTEQALNYMNAVMTPLDKTKDDTWQYLKAVTRGKGARIVDSKRQNLLAELKAVKYEIKKKGAFQSDASLKDAIVRYLELSYIVLKEDFDKILDLEDIAEQSYDLMEAYLLAKEQANDKLDHAFDSVVIAQEQFAGKYNITLLDGEKDKTSEKIEKASETLSYYNEIYLIFFKSYKQEAYVLDALQRNDINGFEQNNNTLVIYCNEGLENLKRIENFRGDANLKVAAQRILGFYKNEAAQDFPAMTDFFIKKDNLDKVQKTFDAKSKKDRTQEDIDKYNKAGQEYNEAAQKANKISEISNNERNKSLNEWNSRVEKFFDTHAKL